MSIFGAAFDNRLKVVGCSCGFGCLSGEPSILSNHINHNLALYLPNFLDESVSMDIKDVLSLVHPRPLVLFSGSQDAIFPGASSVHQWVRELYLRTDNAEMILEQVKDAGHVISGEQKRIMVQFFLRHLT